jgi:hypothetical protein
LDLALDTRWIERPILAPPLDPKNRDGQKKPTADDPIDVLLLNLPGILSDIISSTLLTEPGVRVRVDHDRDAEVVSALAAADPDMAIIGSSGQPDGEWEALLGEFPRLKLLTVVDDGLEGVLYELRPCRTSLGEFSSQTLLDEVRRAKAAVG